LDNNNATSCNGYEPTPAERKLLEVLQNPEHFNKTVADKCRIAEIDTATYYRAMAKPEFCDYYNNEIKASLKSSVGEVIQATKNFAIRFPGNHQDRKILLEMAGAYTEKQQVEVTHGFEKGLKDLIEEE
jgi:hypothetical protein